MKRRILNPRLAAIVSELRHGEMIFVSDSGCGIHESWLRDLAPSVEYLNLGVVSGSPSFEDVVKTLAEAGEFEAVIVPEDMADANKEAFGMLTDLFGENGVHQINCSPELYDLRNKCKAMVQTGDVGVHTNAVLVAAYSDDPPIALDILLGKTQYTTIPKKDRK